MRINKTLFLATFIIILNLFQAQDVLYLTEKFKQLQENQQCSVNSPQYDFQYGLKKVNTIKGITFCDQYAKRTCCSDENFTEVKRKWFKEYSLAINMSPQCQEVFQKLVCYDCDGDIGVNNRRGLCSSFCSNLYRSCIQDVFSFDEKQSNKVRFCRGSDILCSKLRYIFSDGDSFCQALGFEVNLNTNADEWLDDLVMNSTKKNPICWDGTPSQRIFGPAFSLNQFNLNDVKKNLENILAKASSNVSNSINQFFQQFLFGIKKGIQGLWDRFMGIFQ